jgi:hypothetical protein
LTALFNPELRKSYLNSSSRACGKCGKNARIPKYQGVEWIDRLWKTCGKYGELTTQCLYLLKFSREIKRF